MATQSGFVKAADKFYNHNPDKRDFNFACPGNSPQGRKHKLKEERRSQCIQF